MTSAGQNAQGGFRNPIGQGRWYYLLVALSVGFLAPVAFAHAATRLRSVAAWVWPVVYVVAMVLIASLNSSEIAAEEAERPTTNLGGILIIAYMVVAMVHLTYLRRKIWPREPRPQPAAAPPDPAVAAALAARARRQEARQIVETDRALARELRIGRPDLARTYDDGGLVDLNACAAEVIAKYCDIDAGSAQRIVDARQARGVPFVSVDDVFAFNDIPYPLWERILDRGVVI